MISIFYFHYYSYHRESDYQSDPYHTLLFGIVLTPPLIFDILHHSLARSPRLSVLYPVYVLGSHLLIMYHKVESCAVYRRTLYWKRDILGVLAYEEMNLLIFVPSALDSYRMLFQQEFRSPSSRVCPFHTERQPTVFLA